MSAPSDTAKDAAGAADAVADQYGSEAVTTDGSADAIADEFADVLGDTDGTEAGGEILDVNQADLPTTCPGDHPNAGGPCAVPAGKVCGYFPDCCCLGGKYTCVAVEEFTCVLGTWSHSANDLCMSGPEYCPGAWPADAYGAEVDASGQADADAE